MAYHFEADYLQPLELGSIIIQRTLNSEFDIIEEDGGTYTTEYLMMNWGNYGDYDDGYYGTYPSDTWTIDNMEYKYDKTINYNFR